MKLVLVSRLGRAAVAATALLMIALLASGPVLADTDIGTSGVVGKHSLVDTRTKAGVTCSYGPTLLKHLDVRPPRMRAVSGTQAVAWRFAVLRTRYPDTGDATTKTTYTSRWQTASTTTRRNARFSTMGIKVTVPRDGRTWGVYYEYAVRVEMAWLQPNGAITGRSIHRVDNYRWVQGGRASTQGPCGSVAIG